MPASAPNHAYYRRCEGSWRCPFEFTITDPAAFLACPMSPVDRLRIRSMVRWMNWGAFVFATTVDYAARGAQGEVVHTTRLLKWGVPFLSSVESIFLDDDGTGFTLRGQQRFWPLGRARSFTGHGRVDETATRATYDFEWFGTRMRQTTVLVEDGADITQESPWSRGVQRLRRAP